MGLIETYHENVFRELVNHIDAEFCIGSMFESSYLKREYKNWSIILDGDKSSRVTKTRLRVPLVNADGFNFFLRKGNRDRFIARLFNIKYIETGKKQLDDNFCIEGSNCQAIPLIFNNTDIERFITSQDDEEFHMSISGVCYKEGECELNLTYSKVISNNNHLIALLNFTETFLDELVSLNLISDQKPTSILK